MPYLALIDQLNRFIRKKSSLLIMSGYSFNDGHLNDTIVNALKSNPTAMVLGLMHNSFNIDLTGGTSTERYPEAYKLSRNQHNLNVWTFDRAIIGTNEGEWCPRYDGDDTDTNIRAFLTTVRSEDPAIKTQHLVKLGDFAQFTNFLRRIIWSPLGVQ